VVSEIRGSAIVVDTSDTMRRSERDQLAALCRTHQLVGDRMQHRREQRHAQRRDERGEDRDGATTQNLP
jgi:hypothetical protein